MKEKVLIQSYKVDVKKILKITLRVAMVLAAVVIVCSLVSNVIRYNECKKTYDEHKEKGSCGYSFSRYSKCYACEYVEDASPVGDAIGDGVIAFAAPCILVLFILMLLANFSLTVTDKRVYCKVWWIHHTCIPVDSITSVGRIGIFNVLTIVAPSQRIIIVFLLNSKLVYNVLNELLIERQEKPTLTYRVETAEQEKQEPTEAPAPKTTAVADAKPTSTTLSMQENIKAKESAKRAQEQADEMAKRDAEKTANKQPQPNPAIIPPHDTLPDKLSFALMYQSSAGMKNYLKTIEDDRVQAILEGPTDAIRERIQSLLETLK